MTRLKVRVGWLCLAALALSVLSASADLISGRTTVGTTATLVYTAPGRGGTVLLRNTDAAVSVFLGDANVTTANGFELIAGAGVSFPLQKGEKVYAIVSAGTVRVDRIEIGRFP